jgi:hypothetical protein
VGSRSFPSIGVADIQYRAFSPVILKNRLTGKTFLKLTQVWMRHDEVYSAAGI